MAFVLRNGATRVLSVPMIKKIASKLQYPIFLGLGLLFSWWSLKDIDHAKINEIKSALSHSRYWLVVPVFVVFILSHLVRALRWKLLIKTLGYHPRTDNTFYAVMIGYLTNMAVPRLGEIMKCTMLARYEKLPPDKLFGTIILERIVDSFSLFLILVVTLAIQPHIYTQLIDTFFHSTNNSRQENIPGFLFAAILIGVIILGIFLWMLIGKKTFREIITITKQIGKRIWQGVTVILKLKSRGLFLAYTLGLWFLYFLGGYIALFSLHETQQYGVKQAMAILTAGSVGMILTPGGVGAFAFLIKKTMELYGLEAGIALAFGWILWLIDVVVVVSSGVFSFVALPYFNKGKKTSVPQNQIH